MASKFVIFQVPTRQPRVDPGRPELTVHRLAVIGPFDLGKGGHYGGGSYQLYFYVLSVDFGQYQSPSLHPFQLLGLGNYLTCHGDTDIIVREQLVHGVDVAVNLGRAPGFLQLLDLMLVLDLAASGGVRLQPAGGRKTVAAEQPSSQTREPKMTRLE